MTSMICAERRNFKLGARDVALFGYSGNKINGGGHTETHHVPSRKPPTESTDEYSTFAKHRSHAP